MERKGKRVEREGATALLDRKSGEGGWIDRKSGVGGWIDKSLPSALI